MAITRFLRKYLLLLTALSPFLTRYIHSSLLILLVFLATLGQKSSCFGGILSCSFPARFPPAFHPRFGFDNASSIDNLLDKEDVSLEAILDEDELLQECKAQNARLIDYLQRVDVLQRLLGYITGQIEGEDRGRFK